MFHCWSIPLVLSTGPSLNGIGVEAVESGPVPVDALRKAVMSSGTIAERANLELLERLYLRWRQDPASLDENWRAFFEGFELGCEPASSVQGTAPQTAVVRLIYAYRDLGHFLAHLDPLSEPPASSSASGAFRVRLCRGRPRPTLRHQPLHRLADAARSGDCSTPCARPTAAPSASSTCTSRTRDIRRWLQERMEPRRNRPDFDRAAETAHPQATCTTPSCSSTSCTRTTPARSVSRWKAPRR